jgi:hypothetical protein
VLWISSGMLSIPAIMVITPFWYRYPKWDTSCLTVQSFTGRRIFPYDSVIRDR